MSERQRNIRSKRELQRNERMAPGHGGQTPTAMQSQSLLALGVRQTAHSNGTRRLQRGLSAHQDVFNANQLREGLGQRVSAPNGD